MSSDMALRALYLPADTTIDLNAAKATATRLCGQATTDDLARMLDNDAFADVHIDGVPPILDWSDELISRHAAALRAWAEQCLHRLLDEIAASLHHGEVRSWRFGRHTDATDEGVDAYLTGGVSCGSTPTEPYDTWEIWNEPDRYPDGWSDQLSAAAGLLHPHGTGPAARTVTFHTWA